MLSQATRLLDFPTLETMTYLNTAAEGIPPLAVGEALAQYVCDKQRGMDGRTLHFAQWDSARALAGQLYGLSADEIGICSCTSEAYNLAAMALQLRDHDEIVINDLDFPAGATPWLQDTCPATVRVWRACEGALRVEDLSRLLGSRTRLVAASLVSFYNGFMLPLPAVIEVVRAHSPALLALDVTQALGRVPLRLEGVDLIVSSTHKWILASHGGCLVGIPAARARDWNVPAGGWFNLQDPFGPGRFDRAISKPGAAGFMVGMPNFPALYAIRAALDYITQVGVEAIDQAARPLVHACIDGLSRLPVDLLTPRESESLAGIVAFRHPESEELARRLQAQNIHLMSHAGRLRVSIHGYNTMSDIETLLVALDAALRVEPLCQT
jgi:cysteine desulfurase/selenocysteine lyase